MALYKSILAYDGTDFHGLQRQAEGIRTVQSEVEAALREIGWTGSSIHAAGRTDRGVHATGQVISFELAWKHSADELVRALNASLPQDVAVRMVETAPEDFHARYSASCRIYVYRLYFDPVRNPRRDRFGYRAWPSPELGILQQAAELFVGRKDFAAFGSAPDPDGSTVREVYRAQWSEQENGAAFKITANAFLYRMVRKIVWACIATGWMNTSMSELERLLEQTGGRWKAGIAPARGLTLEKVGYEASEILE